MSNTIVLFLRMLLLTFINLYSIRILLDKMGVEYYGIFNAVAGLVTLSSFISGVLDLSIQRFYSYYIGTKQHDRLCHICMYNTKNSLYRHHICSRGHDNLCLNFVHRKSLKIGCRIYDRSRSHEQPHIL